MVTKTKKEKAKRGARRAVQKLPPSEAVKVLEEEAKKKELEAVAAPAPEERVPGRDTGGMKTTWTRKDIEERFPIVELDCEETIKITWNGVVYQLYQGAKHYVPSVIKDVYMRHRQLQRTGGRELPKDSGYETIVELGAGPLPPET